MGPHRGLGWIRGRAVELRRDQRLPVPHVGWNDVRAVGPTPLFSNLPTATNFYFDHSYHVVCDEERDVAAVCAYGSNLVAAVHRDNIFAVQFHPEKSQTKGLELLRNFLNHVEARRC
jgi:glutamine amidotransferase